MKKSQITFEFAAQSLAKDGLYFWTFTFAEILPIKDTRKRWNHFLTLLRRRWPNLCGLRVFELHEFHGLHVHLLTNRFLDVNEARKLAQKAGWGRIHVMRANADTGKYLAKYLSKEREPCFKGWRLWAGFGNWDWSRVKDIEIESSLGTIWKACIETFHWKGNRKFFQRQNVVRQLYFKSIDENWDLKFCTRYLEELKRKKYR